MYLVLTPPSICYSPLIRKISSKCEYQPNFLLRVSKRVRVILWIGLFFFLTVQKTKLMPIYLINYSLRVMHTHLQCCTPRPTLNLVDNLTTPTEPTRSRSPFQIIYMEANHRFLSAHPLNLTCSPSLLRIYIFNPTQVLEF